MNFQPQIKESPELNRLLQQQIKKFVGWEEIPLRYRELLTKISDSYDYFEKDRDAIEQSIELTMHQLRESNAQLSYEKDELARMLNNIGEVFFSVDLVTYRVLQISSQCERMYGLSADYCLQNPNFWFDVVLEEDRPIIKANEALVLQGIPFIQVYRIKRADGAIRWIESKITPSLNEEGKPVRIDGINVDVTERKQAELKLQNSEERYRQIVETAQEGIWMIDENNLTNFVNDKICKLLEYSRQEMMGKSVFDFMDDEGRQIAIKNLESQKEQLLESYEFKYITKTGKTVWTMISTNPIYDGIGKYTGALAMVTDITARKRGEETLRETEKRYSVVSENKLLGIGWANPQGQFIEVNDTFAKMLGYTREEMIGKYPRDFTHQDDLTVNAHEIKRVLAGELENCSYEKRYITRDGSIIWAELNLTGVKNSKGGVIHTIAIIKDITVRRETREALQIKIAELKKSNMELDRFVYSVSHDLRAPLCSMLGLIDLSEDSIQDEFALENMGMLKTSIRKLDGFISDILDYSRNARLDVLNEEVDFKEILGDITNNLKYMASTDRLVDIRVNIDCHAPFYSDKGRLSIILNNLISNAIRYQNPKINDPYVAINVTTHSGEAQIEISDNGIGISEEFQPKVFDMFYRISNKSVGSGLGLYIVKETVAKLKGDVHLHSVPGIGTEFSIQLPNASN